LKVKYLINLFKWLFLKADFKRPSACPKKQVFPRGTIASKVVKAAYIYDK